MSTLVMGLLVAAIGLWSICGASLGQTGARAFFIALGVGMIAQGAFFILAS